MSAAVAAFSSMKVSWVSCKALGEDSLLSGLQRLAERVGVTILRRASLSLTEI